MSLDLKHLTKTQQAAVKHEGLPLLLVAGAGTGKTTTLVYRLAYLLEQGINPKNIVAISFTEKSAQELEDRLFDLVGSKAFDMTVSTFHGWGEKILRENCILAGLSPTFELLDEKGQWQLLYEHLRELGLKKLISLNNPTKNLTAIVRHISRLKDEAVTVERYQAWLKEKQLNADSDTILGVAEEEAVLTFAEYAELCSAYARYEVLLEQKNRVDFGDLILRPLLLMRNNSQILAKLQSQYQYIIVDEFQDTNFAQYEFLRILAGDGSKLTVVGDDDQAIYKFRGASVYNILHFQKDFKNTKTLLMTENFRNPQTLLDLSYKFIQKNNPDRLEAKAQELGQDLSKKLKAVASKSKIKSCEVLSAESLEQEKKLVVKKILALKKNKNFNFNQMAVIARSNDTAQEFARALTDEHIPNIFMASFGLYHTPAALDILAFLRLTIDIYNNPSLYRLLTLPLVAISAETIMKLGAEAKKQATSWWDQLTFVRGRDEGEQKKLEGLIATLLAQQALAHKPETSALTVALNFLDARLGAMSYKQYLIAEDEAGNVWAKQQIFYLAQFLKEMKNFEGASEAPDVRNFLAQIDSAKNAGDFGHLKNNLEQQEPNAVQILTAHAAKGLEFDYVFIVSLVDKRFPSMARAEILPLPPELMQETRPEGDYHLEEERRLMYVALTRAKKMVYLSWAKDYGGSRDKKPSRFLEELNLIAPIKTEKKAKAVLPDSFKVRPSAFAFTPPLTFSFSALETFRRCALQYKFSSVLRIPVPPSQPLVVGDSVHRALQTIFAVLKERQGQKQSTLFAGHSEPKKVGELISDKEVLKYFDAAWKLEWFFDRPAREEAYQHAKNYLWRYFEIIKNDVILPEHLELSWKVNIGKYVFRGKIDRVDRVPGGVMLLDYKTNAGGVEKNVKKTDMKRQLLMYQLVWEKMFQDPVVGLQFIFLSDEKNPLMEPFRAEPEDLEKLEGELILACEKMLVAFAHDKFEPTKSKAICDHCEFREVCPQRIY